MACCRPGTGSIQSTFRHNRTTPNFVARTYRYNLLVLPRSPRTKHRLTNPRNPSRHALQLTVSLCLVRTVRHRDRPNTLVVGRHLHHNIRFGMLEVAVACIHRFPPVHPPQDHRTVFDSRFHFWIATDFRTKLDYLVRKESIAAGPMPGAAMDHTSGWPSLPTPTRTVSFEVQLGFCVPW